MKRTTLHAVKAAKRTGPTFGQLRHALRLFDGDYTTPQQRRANALKWLRSVEQLGASWILAGRKEVAWGAKERSAAK